MTRNDEQPRWTTYDSPIGPLTLAAGPRGLTNLAFPGRLRPPAAATRRPMRAVVDQLEAYFAGDLQSFDLELDLHGTPLQRAVWKELLEIPYGTTMSYGELAGRIDESLYRSDVEPYRRARAVGAANGRNPIAIIVPCHRVIGADGSLTGYGGGLQRKQALLDLERGSVAAEPRASSLRLLRDQSDLADSPFPEPSTPEPMRGHQLL
jgi:methylated-DNA-[protein]-cysteine S-methyltransferase